MKIVVVLVIAVNVLAVTGVSQCKCGEICNHKGRIVRYSNGACKWKCFFNYTGFECNTDPTCKMPNGGIKVCQNTSIRGDCECNCHPYNRGELCETSYCPHMERDYCPFQYSTTCQYDNFMAACPYKCKACQESNRPSCEADENCHTSSHGCKYHGMQPSQEMCRTLGDNGQDYAMCLNGSRTANCTKCNAMYAMTFCPVMCGLCQSLEIRAVPPPTTSRQIPDKVPASLLTTTITEATSKNTPSEIKQICAFPVVEVAAAAVGGFAAAIVITAIVLIILIRKFNLRSIFKRNKCLENVNGPKYIHTLTSQTGDKLSDFVHDATKSNYVHYARVTLDRARKSHALDPRHDELMYFSPEYLLSIQHDQRILDDRMGSLKYFQMDSDGMTSRTTPIYTATNAGSGVTAPSSLRPHSLLRAEHSYMNMCDKPNCDCPTHRIYSSTTSDVYTVNMLDNF